ncbi:MAG: hypothetical protein RLZZ453_563 [Chlamydiota bacterium]|jgi:hypothetical protein
MFLRQSKIILFLLLCSFVKAQETRPPKLLVLIIASDDLPIYKEHQKIWRAYMHLYPKQISSYFLKANPLLDTPYKIEADTIWVKTTETLTPGILEKTIIALEALLPSIREEFDFVLRANLSSFFVFPHLLAFLENCPRQKFYGSGGVTHYYGYDSHRWDHLSGLKRWGHGCGFLLSKDLVEALLSQKPFLQLQAPKGQDDVAIGNALIDICGYPLTLTKRKDILSIADWYRERDCLSRSDYHFRVKNADPEERLSQDLFVYHKLFTHFYPTLKWPCD